MLLDSESSRFAAERKNGLLSAGLILAVLLIPRIASADEFAWSVTPSLDTNPSATDLNYIDSVSGESGVLYSESTAVLIMQGAYVGSWSGAKSAAKEAERLLVDALTARHFRVLVWRDLDSRNLGTVIEETLKENSYSPNGRFFFYYFGHGVTIGHADEPGRQQFFLVPTDAPSSNDEKAFSKAAFLGSTFISLAGAMRTKHTFFAFEACDAGGIMGTLSEPPPPNPQGYLKDPALQQWTQEYLAAGTDV